MNSAQRSQRLNLAFFVCAIVMSAGLLVAAMVTTKLFLSGHADGVAPHAATCISTLSKYGFAPKHKNGVISSTQMLSKDIESRVVLASLLIAHCPSHTLQDFCAGDGCKVPGVSFTLVPRQ